MSRKQKVGSRRKCDTTRYRKRQKSERGKRVIKDQQRRAWEADFVQRFPGIHVPQVKEQS